MGRFLFIDSNLSIIRPSTIIVKCNLESFNCVFLGKISFCSYSHVYKPTKYFTVLKISAVYIKHKSEPKTISCGTLTDTSWKEETVSFSATLKARLER